MTDLQRRMMERLNLTESDFEPSEINIAEEAYLLAEYNSILIEMLMED